MKKNCTTSVFISLLMMAIVFLSSCNTGLKENEKATENETPIKTEVRKIEEGQKPSPEEVLVMLKEGNERFYSGNSVFPNTDSTRLALAGSKNQGDYAYATVISCSDSRVPVEMIFDAGIMDVFVIRVAGNVCDTDEIGSIEYGLAHVNTPVFVMLGHTQCGAVTAVTQAMTGHGHPLERNIPPLVDNIKPAVQKTLESHEDAETEELIPYAIEANIWQGIHDLFMESPATRTLVKEEKVKVVGAIYDVGTGKIEWLPEEKVNDILLAVEKDPERAMEAMAGEFEKEAAH